MRDRGRSRTIGRNKRKTLVAHGRAGGWFAVLALYVQIIAGALCAAGTANAAFDTRADSPFPICQTQPNDTRSAQTQDNDHKDGGHAPAHEHNCLLCSVHCQAAMAPAPSLGGIAAVFAVSIVPQHAAFIFPSVARFPAGAPPRGPPSAV